MDTVCFHSLSCNFSKYFHWCFIRALHASLGFITNHPVTCSIILHVNHMWIISYFKACANIKEFKLRGKKSY